MKKTVIPLPDFLKVLPQPAILAVISYIVMAVVIMLPLNIGDYDPQYQETKNYNFGYRFLLLVILLIPMGLSVYSIYCMMKGSCVVWSWINALVIALWVLLFILATFMSSEQFKNRN